MYVYKLTNKLNGKCYIGATTRSLGRRLSDHWNAARMGRTTAFCDAIREFGPDAFEPSILYTANSLEELLELEIRAIRENNTLVPFGYNRASGGKGTPDCRHLESTKLKIAERARGRVTSEETKAKLSAALKGRPCLWNRGKHRPAWNKGIPHTEEARAKMSAAHKGGRNYNARPIEFNGVEYACITDAVRATGFSMMQVRYRLEKGRAHYLTPRNPETHQETI